MSNFTAIIQAKLDTKNIEKEIQSLNKQTIVFNNISIDTGAIQKSLNKNKFTINIDKINSSAIVGEMKKAGNKAGDAFNSSFNASFIGKAKGLSKATDMFNIGAIDAQINKVIASYERLGSTGHSKLSIVHKDMQQLISLRNQMALAKDGESLAVSYNKFNGILAKTKNNLTQISAQSKSYASALQISTLDNKMRDWLDKNPKAVRAYGSSIDELRGKLASVDKLPISSFNAINEQLKQIDQNAKAAGMAGETFGSRMQRVFKSVASFVSVYSIFYQTAHALREMATSVMNVDTAMTELKKVTDETNNTYSSFLAGSGTIAKNIGTTIADYITSTADFARLGFSLSDSSELAKVANVYAVVGDEIEGIDDATKSVISTMMAFHIEAGDAMSIVDKFNEVGKDYAQ